jgi:hypothetical protein
LHGCLLFCLELQGPADVDPTEAARMISEGIGRKVAYVEATEEQARQGMKAAGMPEFFIDLLFEMYAGLNAGRMERTQPRSSATTTKTSWLEFSRQVLKPAVEAALGR